jgi:hypothetical protein
MNTTTYGNINTVSGSGAITATAALTPFTTGGLCVHAGGQGMNLWPSASNQNIDATQASSNLSITEYLRGNVRIVGMAFEVVNTTADISKQGQVTVWRMPNQATLTTLYNTVATTPAVNSALPGYINRFPPGQIQDAQLLYGSRSWAASEGAYVVARQCDTVNPFERGDFIADLYTNVESSPANASNYWSPQPPTLPQKAQDIHAPFDISGVHFTGLSNATSLTVNVRWLLERSPGPSETDLVVLATPSAAYDPVALELYCQCLQTMPPGVMLKENPLGEWFRKALGAVEKWAPKIGGALNTIIPGAEFVGNLVGKGAGVIKPKEKPKKQPLEGSASNARLLTQR